MPLNTKKHNYADLIARARAADQLETSFASNESYSGSIANKSNKRVQDRLEVMRQITKPIEPKVDLEPSSLSGTWIYSLIEIDTGNMLGIFSNEDKAWAMSEELYALYQIEADVEDIQIDADMYQMATRSRR